MLAFDVEAGIIRVRQSDRICLGGSGLLTHPVG